MSQHQPLTRDQGFCLFKWDKIRLCWGKGGFERMRAKYDTIASLECCSLTLLIREDCLIKRWSIAYRDVLWPWIALFWDVVNILSSTNLWQVTAWPLQTSYMISMQLDLRWCSHGKIYEVNKLQRIPQGSSCLKTW